MKSLAEVFDEVEGSVDGMVSMMVEMISHPALSPMNGGRGESEKADYLMTLLTGFDSVERVDVPDGQDPTVMRSNILARKRGPGKGTLWIISHMDVVPAGDPAMWDTPPFEGVVKNGCVYGRGTEDNGQSVVSSLFAAKPFLDQDLQGMSIGIAYVADEETSSVYGVQYLLDHGYFSEDDAIMVPDYGAGDGAHIEIAEKGMLWLRFTVRGRSTHGSTPELGINAYRISTMLLADLMESFPERFPGTDPEFDTGSTFEPTRRPATVENINTIPGYDEFCVDIRLLPEHGADDVIAFAEGKAAEHSARTGAEIGVEVVQREDPGRPSSTTTEAFDALADSIEKVLGHRPDGRGIGGGTCANFFRLRGMDAYAWQYGGGSLHKPNEHVVISDMVTDAKVYAALIHRMCLSRRRRGGRSSTRCRT